MQITGKKVLILGGYGLVGRAVVYEILEQKPAEIIITSLFQWEAEKALEEFRNFGIPMHTEWGNIFVREEFKDLSRNELLEDKSKRSIFLQDIMESLDEEILTNSALYRLIEKHRPDIIIDCINSATTFAYQDIYSGYYTVKKQLQKWDEDGKPSNEMRCEIEKFLGTAYIPQLIRHVQILYEATGRFGVSSYMKVGTSGTGGMGLNIPYTHSEERPSRVLLSKTSLAGAHSLLLFLMARSTNAPNVKEIKPATAIAWKKIGYGEVMRKGKPIPLYDCPPDKALELGNTLKRGACAECEALNKNLEEVYIDTGENGIFSYGEFYTITGYGQMQFVTPEEIARNVVTEVTGGNAGRDVIGAIDASVMGSTYRAGYMRQAATDRMEQLLKEHQVDSVAFENLGPPRLSKLLFEAHLLKLAGKTLDGVLEYSPADLSRKMSEIISRDANLRSKIISIGIPILMPDGKKVLTGESMKIPPFKDFDELPVNSDTLEDWAFNGWVDLRESNMITLLDWLNRIKGFLGTIDPDDTSSRYHHGIDYWKMDEELHPGKLAIWVFINVDMGERVKD